MNSGNISQMASLFVGVLAVCASVACWLVLRRTIGDCRKEHSEAASGVRESVAALTAKVDSALAELKKLSDRVAEIEQRSTATNDWPADAPPLNLNRRGQVMRLHRRGDSLADIASAIGVSQGEVKLMIKVHQLSRPESKSDGGSSFSRKLSGLYDTDSRLHRREGKA